MSITGQQWCRLEFTAVSRRKSNGPLGYGFVLFEHESGNLVATGAGAVGNAVTYNQAIHIALWEGLKVAVDKGATRVLLHCDSKPSLTQVVSERAAAAASHGPLAAARHLLRNQMTEYRAEKVDRWANGLAVMQAEFAAELHEVLLKVAAAPPSKYVSVAGQLGLLLQLPISARRWLEGADDFMDAAAEVVALRCGSNKADIEATMANKFNINTAYTTVDTTIQQHPSQTTTQVGTSQEHTNPAVVGANVLNNQRQQQQQQQPPLRQQQKDPPVCFCTQRIFTPEEGAAYAAAAAKAEEDAAAHAAVMKELAAEGGAVEDDQTVTDSSTDSEDDVSSSSRRRAKGSKGNKLEHGRLVGRHRMSHRLLVVGLHNLPAGWTGQPALIGSQQQQQQQQEAPVVASSADSLQNHQQADGSESLAAPPSAATAVPSAPDQITDDLVQGSSVLIGGDLIPYWLGRQRAGGAETVGLGSARYQLPQVASDTATHLLQFDGASRNNPGRGGYGYVIFDLTSGQVISRGCMTLPYGMSAGKAEFEGLNAGLQAALDAGIRNLAVQGDSNLVLDAMLYRRGTSSKSCGVAYQKACQLLMNFDHVDFQYVPRNRNTLADRLANISMDIDTAIYALLRKGSDKSGVTDRDALRTLVKAAKINKNQGVLDMLLESFEFPLLMCVLLNRVMALTPEQLLVRLESKAAHMGDPNPTLVQKVRKIVSTGIPADIMQHVGAAIMDSRYSRMDMAKLRRDAALVRRKHPELQGIVQQQQQMQVGQVKHYSQVSVAGSAAGSSAQLSPAGSCLKLQMQQRSLPLFAAWGHQRELQGLVQQQQQMNCGQVRHYSQLPAWQLNEELSATGSSRHPQQWSLLWCAAMMHQQEPQHAVRLPQQHVEQQHCSWDEWHPHPHSSSRGSSECGSSTQRAVQGVQNLVRWTAAAADLSGPCGALRRLLPACRYIR